MPLSIDRAESAFLAGHTHWENFLEKFQAQWLRPLAERQLGMMVRNLPPKVMAQLPPEDLKQLQQMIGGSNGAKMER